MAECSIYLLHYQFFNTLLVGPSYKDMVVAEYEKTAGNQPDFDYTNIVAEELKDLYFACPVRALAR